MKRHPALEQLSRDHHHALVVARHPKRADAGGMARARTAFLDYWRTDGAEHFREEEEVLLPTLAAFADPDQPVIAQVLLDHVRIRRLAAELADRSPARGALHVLGAALERHVRREERELFPLLERAIPNHELRRLGTLLGP